MESITLDLTEPQMAGIKALAEKLGVTPEEAIKMLLDQRLRYEEAIDEVLQNKADLQRRVS